MAGYDRGRFFNFPKLFENVIEAFECAICHSYAKDPVTHSGFDVCNDIFCTFCIKKSLKNQNTCPIDGQLITFNLLTRLPKPFRKLNETMEINCNFQSYGCSTVNKLSELEQHFITCSFKPKKIWTDNNECLKNNKLYSIISETCANRDDELKLFYISQCFFSQNYFAIFSTIKDRVYGFGENSLGQLGQGHSRIIKEVVELPELSGKYVTDIFEGNCCMFARTDDGSVFSWGNSSWGQLGRRFFSTDDQFYKPEIIEFNGKSISRIICGALQNIALTTDGLIYGWGGNNYGQVGCNDKENTQICLPKLIAPEPDKEFKVQYVYCFADYSFAINIDQNVYFWGKNIFNLIPSEPIVYQPKLVQQFRADIIVCNNHAIYFVLDNCIYQYIDKIEPIKKLDLEPVDDLAIDENHLLIALNNKTVHIFDDDQFEPTELSNIFEYYLLEYETTYGTIELVKSKKEQQDQDNLREAFLIPQTKSIDEMELIDQINDYSFKLEPIDDFEFKFIDEKRGHISLIQRVRIEVDEFNQHIKQEVSRLRELDEKTVAKIKQFCIFDSVLYIKIDYYQQNLKTIIDLQANAFKRQKTDRMTSIEFLISLEILIELSECLNYLHSLDPPIVHRDLDPSNILITDGSGNRFIKLSKIGLGQKLEYIDKKLNVSSIGRGSNQHSIGSLTEKKNVPVRSDSGIGSSIANWPTNHFRSSNLRYRAPEVMRGGFYNTRADIFSLGMIALDLFGMETMDDPHSKKYTSLFDGTELEMIYHNVLSTVSACLDPAKCDDRPDCQTVVSQLNKIKLDKTTLVAISDDKILDHLKTFDNQFFINFFRLKVAKNNT